MSLKAWYPFNGHFNNQGSGDLNLIQVTAPTYVADGKVCSQSLSGGGFKWSAQQTNSISNNNALSMAFWIKVLNSSEGSYVLFGTSGMTPPNNRRYTLFNYPSMNDFHWSWQNDTSNSTTNAGVLYDCFPTNVWTHCCITYYDGKCKVYINGELKATTSGYVNNSTYAFETTVLHHCANRYVQDLRFYDHELSAREVKHLAQGLAWHCALDSISNPNLITTMGNGGNSTLLNKYSLLINFEANTDAYGYFNVSPALELNKTYTLSFDVNNFPNGAKWVWQLWNSGNYAFNVTADGHYTYTFTPTSSKLPSGASLTQFLFDDGTRTNALKQVTFSNFKIEAGDSATAWCPHSSDTALYSIFSANANIEQDCSGYGNHGTRVNVKGSSDSARYKQSALFEYGNYIKAGSMSTKNWSELTLSAWVNPSSYSATGSSTDRQTIIIGGVYLTLTGGVVSTYCYGKTSSYYNGTTKVPLNEWSHIAVTYDKAGNLKIYVNGNLEKTYTGFTNPCDASSTHGKKEIGAETDGASRRFQGKISDARIYATALSGDAIKELATVANTYHQNGVFEAYDMIASENTANIKVAKNKTMVGDFDELGYTSGMAIKTLSDGSSWARIHWLDVTKNKTWFSSSEVQFCDLPNRFSKMGLVEHFKTTGLPEGYTLLEYIQSSGTQYIDTGYYWVNEGTKIDVDMTVVTDGTYRSMFGNEEYVDSGSTRYFTGIPHGSGSSYNIYLGSGSVGSFPVTVGTRFKISIETTSDKKYAVLKDGSTILNGSYSGSIRTKAYANITGSNTATTGHIFLFSNHNSARGTTNASTQNMAAMRLYGCKMYDGGHLVRDFIPCKNAGGVVGLYDKQTNKFYTTPTGTFTAGTTLSGKYEFMLTYPRLSATAYNRWSQTSSPNSSTVTGLSKITTAWSGHFGGIRRTNGTSVYNCDTGDTWYAAIGQQGTWTSTQYIPAADGSSQTETELWVRIDNLPIINKVSMLDKKYIQALQIQEL